MLLVFCTVHDDIDCNMYFVCMYRLDVNTIVIICSLNKRL